MIRNIIGRPIVAGVDGSVPALDAARWAADEAARRGAALRLVHAVHISALAFAGGFGPPQDFFDALESDGRRQLAEAETAIRQAHPELDVEVDLRTADPVPTLIDLSDNARLVVLGSRGLGGFSGMLAGSTAVALVAHGHCPVAVIRGGKPDEVPPSQGPVVVGVDGSPASEPALAMAFEEASLRGADLVAVHTWIEFSSDIAYAYALQFFVDWDAIETRERELLAERLAGWQEKYPDITVRRVVTGGRPVDCLLEHAADAQLLVVGSRGRGGFSGMLLGSTSHALIHHAPCPLLVVRPAEAPRVP
jgi:nucleotide-binding universal stress UspA family protein